jgi:hypothetical protein
MIKNRFKGESGYGLGQFELLFYAFGALNEDNMKQVSLSRILVHDVMYSSV